MDEKIENKNKTFEEKIKLSPFIANWLKRQLDIWTDKGILDQAQKDNITDLYILPEQEAIPLSKEKPSINLITTIETIGAFLVGIGVISFVAFNWPRLPNLLKLSVIVTAIVSVHIAGFLILSHRPKFQNTGLNFIFLGNLLYGAGIWLVVQIYHIHQNFPTGVFLWALGSIPFAYVAKSILSYFLAVGLFFLWTLWESIGHREPHLPFLLVLLGLLAPLSYYLRSKLGLGISLIIGGIWLLNNNIFWFEESMSIYLFLPLTLYGVFLLTASNLHLLKETLKEYRQIYLYIGIIIFSIPLFLMSFCGIVKLSPWVLDIARLSTSFWICSSVLLIGILLSRVLLINKDEYLDRIGVIITKILPYLLISAFYVFIIPWTKPFLILTLLPIAIVSFAYWYFGRSRRSINLLLIYLVFWFCFCLIEWEQLFMLFLLFLVYGVGCYMLGWTYISNFQDKTSGDSFKFFGLLIIFISLHAFTSNFINQVFADEYKFPTSFDFWLLVLFFYAGGLFLYGKYVLRFKYPVQKKGMLPEERIIALLLFIIPLILLMVFANKFIGFWYIFFINFFYIGLLIAYLAAGYRRQELYLKILSFIFLVILIMNRYFEIELSLLYKSLLFILTGIIILGVGILLEKNKDKVAIIDE